MRKGIFKIGTNMNIETKVGVLFFLTFALVVSFAYLLGAFNPFSSPYTLNVMYNFAGGIEVGSPVRVMGIKAGKVEDIVFHPEMKMPGGEEVKLNIKISISKSAWSSIRKDSRFYINLAGIIGEKYIEVSPGTLDSPHIQSGDIVRGEDPPRIDQFLSQSYGLAKQLINFFEENKAQMSNTIKTMESLVIHFNKTLMLLEKTSNQKQLKELLKNIVQISGDIAAISHGLRSEETEETLSLIKEMIWRLKELDKEAIKKFLQEEGIKARIAL